LPSRPGTPASRVTCQHRAGANGVTSLSTARITPASQGITRQFRRKRAAEWTRFNPDDLAELEDTLDVLSDPMALADIREADLAYTADNLARRADAVRNLRR